MGRKDPVHLLGRIDRSRRDFVRKLALGTAYAVPVMSTFSLDSVRRKAHAQGVYTSPPAVAAPSVISLGVVVGPPPLYIYSPNETSPYPASSEEMYWVVTYDRPMDKNFSSARKCVVQKASSAGSLSPPCGTDPQGLAAYPPPPAGCPANAGLTWQWNGDGTKEYAMVPNTGEDYQRLYLWLNHSTCDQSSWYRDPEGLLLKPFEGVADVCYQFP